MFYYVLSVLITYSVLTLEDSNHIGHGGSFTTNLQNTSCEDLNYKNNNSLCHITDFESWTCLKRKALAINGTSCSNIRGITGSQYLCRYVEVCAFADQDFSCDGDYNCTIVEDGFINCTNDEHKFITKNCTPSLVYCRNQNDYEYVRGCQDPFDSLDTDFKNHCIDSYENNSETHSIWYFVRIPHYNNDSLQFATLQSTNHSNWTGDASKLCSGKDPSRGTDDTPDQRATIVTVAVVCFIAFIAIVYVVYEGRMKWEKKKQDLKAGVDHFWAVFIASGDAAIPKGEETVSPEMCDAVSGIDKPDDIADDIADDFADDIANNGVEVPLISSHDSPNIYYNRDNPSYITKCQGSIDRCQESSFTSCKIWDIDHSYDQHATRYDAETSIEYRLDVSSDLTERFEPYMSKNLEIGQD